MRGPAPQPHIPASGRPSFQRPKSAHPAERARPAVEGHRDPVSLPSVSSGTMGSIMLSNHGPDLDSLNGPVSTLSASSSTLAVEDSSSQVAGISTANGLPCPQFRAPLLLPTCHSSKTGSRHFSSVHTLHHLDFLTCRARIVLTTARRGQWNINDHLPSRLRRRDRGRPTHRRGM